MGLSAHAINQAVEIAKAAVGAGDKSGVEALNHPEEVAKLIEVVAKKFVDLIAEQ